MSISLSFIRRVSNIQLEHLGAGKFSTREFTYLEASFFGYEGTGGRIRSRRFKTVSDVYLYLNRVQAGGWMTNAEYHQAWVSVLSFEELLPNAERCWGAIPNAHVGDQTVVSRETPAEPGTSSS